MAPSWRSPGQSWETRAPSLRMAIPSPGGTLQLSGVYGYHLAKYRLRLNAPQVPVPLLKITEKLNDFPFLH